MVIVSLRAVPDGEAASLFVGRRGLLRSFVARNDTLSVILKPTNHLSYSLPKAAADGDRLKDRTWENDADPDSKRNAVQ